MAAAILTVYGAVVKACCGTASAACRGMIRLAVISRVVSHASAIVLVAGGIAWLFAPDYAFSILGLSLPSKAMWIGQLLGAAWLGFAALNWIHRRAVLGGVYGRPVVMANLFNFFIGSMVLIKAGQQGAGSAWPLAIPFSALALAYAALLFRGPFDK